MSIIGKLAQKGKAERTQDYYAVVPEGYVPSGPYHDQLARLGQKLLMLTSVYKERREQRHWISFSTDTFKSMFGGNGAIVKKLAIESGLIELNKKYYPGVFPQSVRLAEPFRTGRFSTVKLNNKPRVKKPSQEEVDRLKPVGVLLRSKFDQFAVHESVAPTDPWNCYSLNRVRARDYYCMRCEHGRFHSNFTSLPKEIRRHLVIESGEQLASIDIRNCQPLILGILASQRDRSPPNADAIPICYTLSAYLELCERGTMYEFCQGRFQDGKVDPYWVHPKPNKKFGIDPETGMQVVTEEIARKPFLVDPSKWKGKRGREKVKKTFINCLFGTVNQTLDNPIYKLFLVDFPGIAEYLISKKQGKYQALAHACQGLESELMIDGVAAEFMRLHPDSPILTIHDEVIVPKKHVESLRSIIIDRFRLEGVNVDPKCEDLK